MQTNDEVLALFDRVPRDPHRQGNQAEISFTWRAVGFDPVMTSIGINNLGRTHLADELIDRGLLFGRAFCTQKKGK